MYLNFVMLAGSTAVLEWDMFTVSGINIRVPILLDKVSLTFSAVVLTISFRVMLFSSSYISGDRNLEYFIFIVLIFILSINLLIYSPNLISLLVGWDGLGFTSYLLVIYYGNRNSLAAGIITAITNRIGDALLILAVSWSAIRGSWSGFFSSSRLIWYTVLALFLAALTKSAQLPFSAWLPAAMAAPTPVSALVHSSTLVTAGIYLIIRFYPSLSLFIYFQRLCFYIGVITCLIARLGATLEYDLKKIIALSTLRQLGVIIMALGINQPILAFFHLATHALFKALLFICAGNIIHRLNNNQDIRLIGSLRHSIPVTCTVLNVANISLCGLPFLAGFYSKDLIIEIFFLSNQSLITRLLIVVRVCLTSLYTIKLSLITLWTPFKGGRVTPGSDCSKYRFIAYLILLGGAVIRGALLSWALNPLTTPTILPQPLKLLVLGLIVALAILCYLFIDTISIVPLHGFASMWFLRFLTAAPLNSLVANLGKLYSYREITWIESFSGKGSIAIVQNATEKLQRLNNISLPRLLSLCLAITTTLLLIL